MSNRTPCDYYVPKGFVGWATVTFGVRSAPRLPVRNGRYVVRFPQSAKVETSTPFEAGWAKDRYWCEAPGSVRELARTGWGGGGNIWAGSVRGSTKEPPISEDFFVGTEHQYYKAVHDPRGTQ